MNFDLSDEHELIRGTVRDFARGEVAPVAGELDATKAFPYAITAQMGQLGLMGIPFSVSPPPPPYSRSVTTSPTDRSHAAAQPRPPAPRRR
ncbi:MAG: acyl-CoA dehydrogenase family protein [Actinomycetota bacterium]|nr:acyl-CoA dehydrogenase family protein [Actinomycetota bacterium]